MSWGEFLREDMRLVILRLLEELPANTSNSSVICAGLERLGHVVSRDQVKTELCWLQEQGLVTLEAFGDLRIARLTERGSDVAIGKARVDGVKRPRP